MAEQETRDSFKRKTVFFPDVGRFVSCGCFVRYDVPVAAWSCCWHSEEDYYFFAGLVNGRVLLFDVRNTTQHVDAVGESGPGTGGVGSGPVVSLAHVKPSLLATSCR